MIYHSYVLSCQIRHTRADKVHDRKYLCRIDNSAPVGFYDDRCLRRLSISDKHALFRCCQVHTGRLDRADLGDGASQLDLNCVVISNLLHELACRHGATLSESPHPTFRRCAGNSLRCQENTRCLKVAFRHLQATSGLVDADIIISTLKSLKSKLYVCGFEPIGYTAKRCRRHN